MRRPSVVKFELPQRLQSWLASQAESLRPRDIAQSIQRLSDFYIANPEAATPWRESWCQEAQIFYYLPLNVLRAQCALQRLRFSGLAGNFARVIDIGSGLGTMFWAMEDSLGPAGFDQKRLYFTEVAEPAKRVLQGFFPQSQEWQTKDSVGLAQSVNDSDLVCFSYSLTEEILGSERLTDLPQFLVIEPSTQDDGRKLMTWRNEALARGLHLRGPCTHRETCPLLISAKDWCHDRLHFVKPEWLSEVEKHLPFRNDTLTFSYLLASRRPLVMASAEENLSEAVYRVVGDSLPERGKTRQLVCGQGQREFLSWLHRHGEPPEIPRGALVSVNKAWRRVSDEIRVESAVDFRI